MKHINDMNLSWNYSKCSSKYFNYCGDENLVDWLMGQGLLEDEILSAVEIADDYLVGLVADGRDCCCVIWFD